MPGWREQPSLVVALVQRYLEHDLDVLMAVPQARSKDRVRSADPGLCHQFCILLHSHGTELTHPVGDETKHHRLGVRRPCRPPPKRAVSDKRGKGK